MRYITINLPSVAVSLALADILIKNHFIDLNSKEEITVSINVRDCEITNKYFLDYLTSQLRKYNNVTAIIRKGTGPEAIKKLDYIFNKVFSTAALVTLIETLQTNMYKEIDSVGEYVAVTYTVKNIEELATAILQRGFTLKEDD